jgi:hypothetical protein
VLLLIDRYVPVALTLLGRVIVNIFLFHFLMKPSGLPLVVVVAVLWSLVFVSVPSAFAGIFKGNHGREPGVASGVLMRKPQ